jgi:hypothetical protein
MKAILEFNLDDIDDKAAHLRAVQSLDMALCLHSIKEDLRAKVKYAPDSMEEAEYKTWVEAQQLILSQLSEHGIDLDSILL